MALSWLEGCWKYWGFEMATEGVMARSHSESWGGRELPVLGAATLKPRTPIEVRTNGSESKSVYTGP